MVAIQFATGHAQQQLLRMARQRPRCNANNSLARSAEAQILVRRVAGMAGLVGAPDSKSGDGDIVGVRFSLPAPALQKVSWGRVACIRTASGAHELIPPH